MPGHEHIVFIAYARPEALEVGRLADRLVLTAKLLDAGAYGVICPMINSKAEAEALVGACRYPPRGARSFGPNRASLWRRRLLAARE